ncbi:MAG: [protein-PII] uridylyltransferase [Ghiorsea sp.]
MNLENARYVEQGKLALEATYQEVNTAFEQGKSGAELMQLMCSAVDALLIDLWQNIAPISSQHIDFVAVGGYGRGELAPQSDWDVWFLVPEQVSDEIKEDIQQFLYVMWDMNAKIGHAVRSVNETLLHVKEDWNSATAAQETRLLHGKGDFLSALKQEMASFFKKQRRQFVEAKLLEHQARHLRTGNTAFMMEPDIKECQGGLRDVQSIFWISKAWFGEDSVQSLEDNAHISHREMKDLITARDFLWRCRVGLHLQTKRPNDRLSFEQQATLADIMAYQPAAHLPPADGLMKDYFRHAGRIARVTGLLLQDFNEKLKPIRWRRTKKIEHGFTLKAQKVGIQRANIFQKDPLCLLRIFHVGQQDQRSLSSSALRHIREDVLLIDDDFRNNPEAKKLFLRILRHPRNIFWALKEMNATGILGRFIPEFRDVVGLGQFNQYHSYTVDEHTIRAIGEARNMLHGDREMRLPLAHEVFHKLKRHDLLYLALLFHDIAKGLPGDHSILGEGLALKFCKHIGIGEDGAKLVAWLVREHLTMAVTSQRCDLSDPEVIREFAEKVGNMERLNSLLCLSVADIAAVGPNVWNDWKGSLLAQLYHATRRALMEEVVTPETIAAQRQTRISSTLLLARADLPLQKELELVLNDIPNRCLTHFPPNQLFPIGKLLAEPTWIEGKSMHSVGYYIDKDRCDTMIMVAATEQPALFTKLTGVIAAGQVNVVAAHAYELSEGKVLDVFYVQDKQGNALSHESDLRRLIARIVKALDSNSPLAPPKKSSKKSTLLMQHVDVRVRSLPFASSKQTAIEVAAAERPALLATLAYIISQAGFEIRGASISSFGERVVDVFFIHLADGSQLSAAQIQQLCAKLHEAATLQDSKGGA